MRFLVSILLFSLCVSAFSQALNEEVYTFNGVVKEANTQKPIEFGAIKNMSTGEVILSDITGAFQIDGSVGDTLRFHSMGYVDTTWVVPTIWTTMEDQLALEVSTNVYAITEVEVLRFYSYAHFRQAFKDLELPKDENEEVKEMVSSWNFEEAIAWGKADKKFNQGTFGAGISLGSGKTRIDKQKDEVKKLEKIELESAKFNHITSRENLADLTGYKGICLDSFMVFLNSNYSIHYKMPEYELLSSILGAYEDFKELKSQEDWYSVDSDSIHIQ
ncbi:hypothetical protein [Plebeiibacterium sediminum]|uniref:Carboxypeptidase-like regulatory domain-containing protein n=1 Tax=Plebeiibacterium sediminum TaxID=2992112 RepID=A0AAE3M1N7_9BACT|nr:hypothetical protein [Plebeiobacterium sediminum]MCW3785079.1 hypothetical protein [Plebeiobacterium sediminum]